MLTAREWLVVVGIAVCGAAATMIVRAMLFAFRLAYGIAVQSLSALLFWALIGLLLVFFLRRRPSRRSE